MADPKIPAPDAHVTPSAPRRQHRRSMRDTAMRLHVGAYLGDTMHLSTVQHGAYFLLLMHYWRTGPLPADDAKLAAIAKMSRKEWQQSSHVVLEQFTIIHATLHPKQPKRYVRGHFPLTATLNPPLLRVALNQPRSQEPSR